MRLDGVEYKILVEQSPILIWRAGTDALCNYFNSRWLDFTGRTMEQEIGNGWAEGVHPEDFDRCLEIYLKNFEARERFEMDYRLKRHDGQYRWINDTGGPFFNSKGEFCGFIGSCVDVTPQYEAQEQKEKVYRATIKGANHIINNLLNQMHLVKMEIDEQPGFDPKVSQCWDLMVEQASELLVRLSSVKEVSDEVILRSVHD